MATSIKLGEICTSINGLWKGKKEPFIKVGVLRNANFTKDFTLDYSKTEYLDVEVRQYEKRKLEKGDLIVEKSGGSEKQPVGRTVLFEAENGEYSFSNFTSVLRVKNKNLFLSKYLYYNILYIYRRGDTKTMQKATTGIHNLDFDLFLNILIVLRSFNDQQKIVEYLDSTFEKIDKIKEDAEKKIAEAKLLFQAALNEKLKMREGWKEVMLKEIGKTQTGTTPSKSCADNYGDYMPFVRPAELNIDNNGTINYDTEIKLSEKGVTKTRLIKANSILMCCIGSVGKTGYNLKDVTCNQQINTLTPKKDFISKYIYYALVTSSFQNNVIKIANSAKATLSIISKGKWEQLMIPIPSFSEQESIVTELDSLSEKTKAIEEKCQQIITECDRLKQAILKHVFE